MYLPPSMLALHAAVCAITSCSDVTIKVVMWEDTRTHTKLFFFNSYEFQISEVSLSVE
jgi:hypothetical protein